MHVCVRGSIVGIWVVIKAKGIITIGDCWGFMFVSAFFKGNYCILRASRDEMLSSLYKAG